MSKVDDAGQLWMMPSLRHGGVSRVTLFDCLPAIGAPWAGIVDACQLNFEKRQLSRKLETTAILQRVPYEEKCHCFQLR